MNYCNCYSRSRTTGQVWERAIVESATLALSDTTHSTTKIEGIPLRILCRTVGGRVIEYAINPTGNAW
jgi:hypothetical protein